MAGRNTDFADARRGLRRRAGIRSRIAITLVCLGIFLLLRIFNPLPVERLRDTAIGRAIEMARIVPVEKNTGPAPTVVIVDIDDATIARYGRWPLPRNVLAQLLDVVKAGKPLSVGFPYVFTGASEGQDVDRKLAESLRGGHVVLGTAQVRSSRAFDAANMPAASVRLDNADALDAMPYFERLMPIPELFMGSVAGAGLLSIQLSHNGVPRRLPTVVRHGNGLAPSLPVEMMRVALGGQYILVSGTASGLRRISIAGRTIRTDPNGMVWFGIDRSRQLRRISALDILEGREGPDSFRSGYVLIGSTAAGLSAEHVAADGGPLPGLDALAHALSALAGDGTFHYPVASIVLEIALALLLGACAYLANSRFGVRIFLASSLGMFAALWGGAAVMIARTGQILDPGLLSLFLAFLFTALILNTYRLARQESSEVIAEKEKEVSILREDSARVAVAAANPRLSIALSHELRQPLAAARNYLGAIRRLAGRDPDGSVDRLANYADEASRQISSMTEIMNELSEIVRGDLTLMREDGLDAVLLDAVAATMVSADDRDVRLIKKFPESLPAVLLNRRQIQLVVSNLARNAIEAPRNRRELVLVLGLRVVDEEWVEVSLADNAAGIPEHLRDRVFSRFESSKARGSGIGLALCRDIVEAHGGRIWFDTAPGTGTTFFFTLRRAR